MNRTACHRASRAIWACVALALLLGLLFPVAAAPIVGGEPDRGAHPNVGMLVGYDEIGPYYSCSGTLIGPSVFLTAAHCLPGGSPEAGNPAEIRISFDDSFTLGVDSFGPFPIVDRFVRGTPYRHPAFDPDAPFDPAYASADLGVFVLDRPAAQVFPGIRAAPLPRHAYLDRLPGRDRADFRLVGYGLQGSIRPRRPDFFIDFTRRTAAAKFVKLLTPSAFLLQGSPSSSPQTGSGTVCSGDSGGAVLRGELLTGVISGGDFCHSKTLAVRLDTVFARNFLGRFVALP